MKRLNLNPPQPRGIDGSAVEQGAKFRDTGYLGVKKEKQGLQGFLLEAEHRDLTSLKGKAKP